MYSTEWVPYFMCTKEELNKRLNTPGHKRLLHAVGIPPGGLILIWED